MASDRPSARTEVGVEDVGTEQHREELEPVDDGLLVLVARGAQQLVGVVCAVDVGLRVNHHEVDVTVDGEREQDRENEQRDEVDEDLEGRYREPPADLDHLEVGLHLVAVVVV
jgi:hypothetical protein